MHCGARHLILKKIKIEPCSVAKKQQRKLKQQA